MGWSQDTYEQPAGDIVTLTLNLTTAGSATGNTSSGPAVRNDAYVQLGSVTTGFIDVLHVVDSDNDGEVTLAINTRTLGTSDSLSATNTELVYHSEGDQVQSAVHGRLPDGEAAPTFLDRDGAQLGGFNAYLEALGLIDGQTNDRGINQLQQPLQPGAYPVVASTGGEFQVNDTEQAPTTATEPAVVSKSISPKLGEATITLTKPGIDGVTVQAAPAGPANGVSNQTALAQSLTEQSSITTADRLVITADATGIYGHLVAIEGEFDALTTGMSPRTLSQLETRTGEGVQFAIEAREGSVVQGPGTRDSIESPLEVVDLSAVDPSAVSVYANQSAGTLYVVVDPRAINDLSVGEAEGRAFSASLAYETDASEPFRFDREDRNIQTYYRGLLGGAGGDVNEPAFPYLAPGEQAAGTTSFTLTRPQARFASNRSDTSADRLLLERSANVTIRGTTNIAPGTEATLQVRSSASNTALSYIRESTVTVAANHTFAGTVDVSASAVGDTISVSLLADDAQIASTTAEIVAPQSPTGMNMTTGERTASETETDATAESGGGVPGFTPLVSLAAIVALLLGLCVLHRADR
ncbi:BGTF surface domain-containing protein [Halobacterium noricense]|uniref:BGTF surface domain-containing protein n=1 Tax=Halobacterium noricense TaxID=223182 RepID=UPI001E35AFB3|nr:BGTF surface domain-containing protein [Halobacterium noricense]UHH26552.1 cell surface protein [Halobacterium noricense]